MGGEANDEQATEKREREKERARMTRLEISGCGGPVVCFELRDEGKVLGKVRMPGREMLKKGQRASCCCTSAEKVLRPWGGGDK